MKSGLTKYFFLLIGETFLIIVGILFTLQLSNWDRDHEYREIEKLYYQDIKVQFKDDKADLLNQINHSNYFLVLYKTTLKSLLKMKS